MTMTKIKAARHLIALASLMLAITLLIPGSALGKTKERPLKLSVSGTSVSNLETFTNHYEGTVSASHASHLGKGAIVEGNGAFGFNEFGTLNYKDSWVITTAKGDTLFGSSNGTITFVPEGFEVAVVQPIEGGTGRFTNASGKLAGTYHLVLTSSAWPLFTYSDQGSAEGRISY
jgi:hypothetical protein